MNVITSSKRRMYRFGFSWVIFGLGLSFTLEANDDETIPVDRPAKQLVDEVAADDFLVIGIPEESEVKVIRPPLYRKVTMDFENRPLDEVLESLCMAAGVKLELDADRLTSAGYLKETSVTAKSGRILLEDAFAQVLKPFERVSFTPDGDKIFVSTKQRVKARANGRVINGRPSAVTNQFDPNEGSNTSEIVSDHEQELESRLNRVFNDSVEKSPASDVLADIATKLGLTLKIDRAGIWAGGGDDLSLTMEVTLMDICDFFMERPVTLGLPEWALNMVKRGDGTIRCKEALIALTEPLALDFCIFGDTLFVSHPQVIAASRKSKDLGSDRNPGAMDNVVRTRIVVQRNHQVGMPIELTVQMRNFNQTDVVFNSEDVSFERSIHVIGSDGIPLERRESPAKPLNRLITLTHLKPAGFYLADLRTWFDVSEPGSYTIQFRIPASAEAGISESTVTQPRTTPLIESLPIEIVLE